MEDFAVNFVYCIYKVKSCFNNQYNLNIWSTHQTQNVPLTFPNGPMRLFFWGTKQDR